MLNVIMLSVVSPIKVCDIWLAFRSSTVVEHETHKPKVGGSNRAARTSLTFLILLFQVLRKEHIRESFVNTHPMGLNLKS